MTKWTIPGPTRQGAVGAALARLRKETACDCAKRFTDYGTHGHDCMAFLRRDVDMLGLRIIADRAIYAAALNAIEALEAENARLRAAHLTIIQSAPTLQYAIQTSRDALYPKEGGE